MLNEFQDKLIQKNVLNKHYTKNKTNNTLSNHHIELKT